MSLAEKLDHVRIDIKIDFKEQFYVVNKTFSVK